MTTRSRTPFRHLTQFQLSSRPRPPPTTTDKGLTEAFRSQRSEQAYRRSHRCRGRLQDLGAQDLKGIAELVRAWALRASSVESRFEAFEYADQGTLRPFGTFALLLL